MRLRRSIPRSSDAASPGAPRCPGDRATGSEGRGSGGELLEDVAHRLGALLPGGKLGVDAQAVGAGEARAAAFAPDEIDHLGAVERRVLDELQLHRLVRRVDARNT